MAKDKDPKPDKELPSSVTLAHQYGYYDDAGTLRMWYAGHTITDPDQIEDLILRGAPLVDD